MKRVFRGLVGLVVLMASTGGAFGAATPSQGVKFLGFEVGEERRYMLGPEQALGADERGYWWIRLDEVYSAGAVPEGVFLLGHEWQMPTLVGEVAIGTIMSVQSEGSIRVNAHGFPLMIEYETNRHLAGMGNQAYTIDYQIEDDNRRFKKRTTAEGERWYQNVPIHNHDELDRSVPVGLFAFLPSVPGCLDRPVQSYDQMRSVGPQPRSANSGSSPQPTLPTTVSITDHADCEESMFAHLGLLSLAMPALWEARGERDYLFFTPVGPVGESRSGVRAAQIGGGSGLPPGISQPGGMGRGFPPSGSMNPLDADPLSNAVYHQTDTLTFIERAPIDIGPRTVEAWLIEISNRYGPIYVDDDGRVIRIDLPPSGGARERWIRMLWPSEF